MRLTSLLSITALMAFTTAVPTTPNLLITRRAQLAGLDKTSESESLDTCPTGFGQCGVITFKSGTFAPFGEGTCIQLAGNIADIYVGHCYCSLWETCTGHGGQDAFVGGMQMCEKPKKIEEFGGKQVKYISCGGLA